MIKYKLQFLIFPRDKAARIYLILVKSAVEEALPHQ
jgi:hypothetical protein